MRQRTVSILKQYARIGAVGLIYALWLKSTGIGIPCIIRMMTGFRCPGCGISHMCMELLQGNLVEAFHWNRGIFLMIPILFILWGRYLYRYIRKGIRRLERIDRVILICCIIEAALWGILRNLPAFLYLN